MAQPQKDLVMPTVAYKNCNQTCDTTLSRRLVYIRVRECKERQLRETD